MFHMLLLHGKQSNDVHSKMPQFRLDGETEYKVGEIKGHHDRQGDIQYLILFVTFDSLENMWLSAA